MWDAATHFVAKGLPGLITPKGLTNVMGGIMTGHIQYWTIIGRKDGKSEILGAVTTMIGTDTYLDIRRLWIYSLYVRPEFRVIMGAWHQIFDSIQRYAKKMGCSEVDALSHNPKAAKIAQNLGFSCNAWMKKEV